MDLKGSDRVTVCGTGPEWSGRSEENQDISHYGNGPGRDSKRIPPIYNSEPLPLELICSVFFSTTDRPYCHLSWALLVHHLQNDKHSCHCCHQKKYHKFSLRLSGVPVLSPALTYQPEESCLYRRHSHLITPSSPPPPPLEAGKEPNTLIKFVF